MAARQYARQYARQAIESLSGRTIAVGLEFPRAKNTAVNVSGSRFLCPNHFATFSSTGVNTGGQRTSSLFALTVASNTSAGTLTITS